MKHVPHLHREIGHQGRDSKSNQEDICEDERSQGIGQLLHLLVSALFFHLPPKVQNEIEGRTIRSNPDRYHQHQCLVL